MASVISSIFTVVDTVMWSFTQIVYGVVYIFNVNVQLVSVVLIGFELAFQQLLSAISLIGYALATVLQSLVFGATNLAEGFAFMVYYAEDAFIQFATWLIYLVPNTLRGIFIVAVWIQQTITFIAYNILPLLEQAGTILVAGLKSLVSYSANFTIVVAMSIMTLFTLLIHGLYKLFALTVFTVYSALNETYQFVIGNTRTHEADEVWRKQDEKYESSSPFYDSEDEAHFWSKHPYIMKEPVTMYESLHESVSQFVFSVFDVMSYLAICIAVVCATIAIITLLYCLYSNAMSSVNALVTLFHRSLFRSDRSIIMDADNIPGTHQAIPVPQPGPLRRRNLIVDDLSDAESEDSLHFPTAGPPNAVRVAAADDNDVPGPSGIQAAVPRSRIPRSKSRASDLLASNRSPTPGSPGGLARDLRRQLDEERDRKLCVVCQDNEKHILLFPCKHLCVCIECTEEIVSSSIDRRKCPLCRGRISSYLEVYA
ncbi:uncharacterized protein [Amphiura filiformis]|uniref:uncharacterized protein n=1 Tax=Amphiura filiformis TaxID=82378 RepID=UPI003B21EC28